MKNDVIITIVVIYVLIKKLYTLYFTNNHKNLIFYCKVIFLKDIQRNSFSFKFSSIQSKFLGLFLLKKLIAEMIKFINSWIMLI